MNLATLPPGAPLLEALARWWLDRAGGDPLRLADGLILVPTRRAARALQDAFLPLSGGRPLLLPRIAALGALDEAPLQLAGSLDLPPAVDEQVRIAHLTRLVMALDGEYGAPATADRAWELAIELADLIDEAHRAEVDLPDRLPDAAEAGYAEHWGRTIEFLQIVTSAWPRWLRDNGLLDPAARQVRLLDCQTRHWEERPPAHPVVVAGATGGIASVARMIRAVARLPQGLVLLPGLDLDMPEDTWNEELEDNHPQAGLRRLLNGLDARRGDVTPWAVSGPAAPDGAAETAMARVPEGRAKALWQALLPASALGAWRQEERGGNGIPARGMAAATQPAAAATASVEGLQRLEPADQQEEATAIALALRDALEAPGARAALVTPDRSLAVRVAAELARFGVIVDDSAGEELGETPPGAFLRLAVRAVADGLRPVVLLALLKHPLAALGLPPARCRAAARHLELLCLRGPAPPPGLDGLRGTVQQRAGAARPEALDLLDRLEVRLRPVMAVAARSDATPADALEALLRATEALAETDEQAGAERLWAGEEGEALAAHLTALRAALPMLPAQPVTTLPGLLDASMKGAVVRGGRRALRGRAGAAAAAAEEHPRVSIWGLLEARLQSVDLIVLGGLAEGVWPSATDPGPWMSRPMRQACGLSSPEERQGQLAHDFVMTACAAPRAILSCPQRRDGAPTVPARWLTRLDAYLRGRPEGAGSSSMAGLPHHPAVAWARALDQPVRGPEPVGPPQPRPPVDRRPRRLRITEIETWLRDPYSIYARHVLRLRPLEPLEPDIGVADYGTLVHRAMARFLEGLPAGARYPADAGRRLRRVMDDALDEAGLNPALAAWWRPRLHRLADWAAEEERRRRQERAPVLIRSELSGEWQVPAPGLPFQLRGRADRIERLADGTLAIIDYKTGTVPGRADVESGYAPQLPLEAAMAAAGAFGQDLAGPVSELTYWHLTGGRTPGEVKSLYADDAEAVGEIVLTAEDRLARLIAAYDDPGRAYLSQPAPGQAPRFGEYGQLARVAEWAVAEDAG